jgi:general stress protein 26
MENIMTKEIEKIANQILDKCDSVQLASITEDGFPRICEMEKVLAKNIYEIILVTGKNSKKIEHYTKNNKASIGFSDENNSISLMGYVKVMEIEYIKEQLKNNNELERWFKKDKNNEYVYCVLNFKIKKADFFISGKKWEYATNEY